MLLPALPWERAGKAWASMEEVLEVVVFLASDRAQYANGTETPINGDYSVNAR